MGLSLETTEYWNILKKVGSLSRLFSDSQDPYLVSRFVEKLFVHCSGGRDFSRRDMSFDAQLLAGGGVGVKTFISPSFTATKMEKIAEFNASATRGEFGGISGIELATKVSNLRNMRVSSDIQIYNIEKSNSIYHCLVRSKNYCLIHEEPYELIDLESIEILDSGVRTKHLQFRDDKSVYKFDSSKNTLFKAFDLSSGSNSEPIYIELIENIFDSLLENRIFTELSSSDSISHNGKVDMQLTSEIDFVVLPLYSTRSHDVPAKSGINQWNAGGRTRNFGEAYIPIPKEVRTLHANFLPESEVPFKLVMPNERVLTVKVCQQDGKALMSNPNGDLCEWLFSLIDHSEWTSRKRLIEKRPYTYEDLLAIGQDSVKISKISDLKYELTPMPVGSYEAFIEGTLST